MKKILILLSLFILINSCIKDNVNLPTVITSPITEIRWDDATAGGEVINDGGSPITARGVCVTTSDTDLPTITDSWNTWHTTDSTGVGSFTSNFKLVWAGAAHTIMQQHYIRAYATNIKGTAYGEVLSCLPVTKPPSSDAIKLNNIRAKARSAIISYSTETIPYYIIDEIGICYSTISNPTFEGDHVLASQGYSNSLTIENLEQNTTYYVKGYVKNQSGISYSEESSFMTWEGEISDIEGNIYQIKTIGSHIWTINNLETTKFNNGSNITLVQEDLLWGSTSTSAYCTYTNFGKLYNYYAIVDIRNLCPVGWHIPSDEDWKSLETSLGMTQTQADASGLRGTDEGGKLKYVNKSIDEGWNFPNVGANNSSGFSAYGAGFRNQEGILTNENLSANFWTKTEYDATTAWSRSLSLDNAQIVRLNIKKGYGFSVRCIKD